MKMPAIPQDGVAPTCRTIHVAGIQVNVFGLDNVKGSPSVNVAFFLHGRMGCAADLVNGVWHIYNNLGQVETPLLLITFDHRNHAARTVDASRNVSWAESNQTHAQDMLSIQTGTAQDVSLIMDYLASVLFPMDEVCVTRWICMGASLGGHSSWIAGARDPRITHVVPMVGSPNMFELLSKRAQNSAPPLHFGPPLVPKALQEHMRRSDPAAEAEAFDGKEILVLSGGIDKLVNYVDGGSEAFVKDLQTRGKCDVEVWVQPKTGHKITKEMLERVAIFLRKANQKKPSNTNHL